MVHLGRTWRFDLRVHPPPTWDAIVQLYRVRWHKTSEKPRLSLQHRLQGNVIQHRILELVGDFYASGVRVATHIDDPFSFAVEDFGHILGQKSSPEPRQGCCR